MSEISKIIKDKDSILVFDVDGVLAKIEFGKYNHFIEEEEWKKANKVAPLQPKRYAEILAQRIKWAEANGIDTDFVQLLMDAIHKESLKRQE